MARRCTSMSDGKKILLHLGLPKTASTFLQRQVFPELAIGDTRFFGKTSNGNWNDPRLWRGVRDYCLARDDTAYAAATAELQTLRCNAIFSSEDFLNPFGFRQKQLVPELVPTYERLDRFMGLVTDKSRVRLLVVSRRPQDWFASFHFECLKQGYFANLDQTAFCEALSCECDWASDVLNNPDLAQTLRKRYPGVEVESLVMEYLLKDPLTALSPSAAFLGVPTKGIKIDLRGINQRTLQGDNVYLKASDRSFLRGRLLRQILYPGLSRSARIARLKLLLSTYAGRVRRRGLPRKCHLLTLNRSSQHPGRTGRIHD